MVQGKGIFAEGPSLCFLSNDPLDIRASKTSACFWYGIAALAHKKAFSCVLMWCVNPSADPVGNSAFV